MSNKFTFLLASALAAVTLALPTPTQAQVVAPIFEQAPMVLYETYKGVDGPTFVDYFEGLVEKYRGTDTHPWGTYRENGTVAYRITPLPNRWETFTAVREARNAGAQAFTDAERKLWNTAWGTRHAAIYGAQPNLSVVPDGFSVADIQGLPFNRVMIYHVKWDQAATFREALAARCALDREANIDNFVLTTWAGGLGTESQTYMIRVSAESRTADAGPNLQARRTARESYIDEWLKLSRAMDAATTHIERHDQRRVPELSFPSGS